MSPLSSDPERRRSQLANLLKGTSDDPEIAERQRAGLRRDARMSHGATSEVRLRPLRDRYIRELQDELPHASERRLRVQGHRLAQLELLAAHADEHGVIADYGRGLVYPAVMLAEKVAGAFLAEHVRLEAEEGEREADAVRRVPPAEGAGGRRRHERGNSMRPPGGIGSSDRTAPPCGGSFSCGRNFRDHSGVV